MADMYKEAKEAGNYDISNNNCHHMANILFNHALQDNSRKALVAEIRLHSKFVYCIESRYQYLPPNDS